MHFLAMPDGQPLQAAELVQAEGDVKDSAASQRELSQLDHAQKVYGQE